MGMSLFGIYVSDTCGISSRDAACQLRLIEHDAKPTERISNILELDADGLVATGDAGSWGIIFGDSGAILDKDISSELSRLSQNGKVLMWLTQSTTGGLWFELHEHGTLRRKWVEVESEVAESTGAPLPEEPAGVFTDEPDSEGERDEWGVIGVAEGVTRLTWEQMGIPGEVYRAR